MNAASEGIRVRSKEVARVIIESSCLKYATQDTKDKMNNFTDSFNHFKKHVVLSTETFLSIVNCTWPLLI